MAHNLVMFMRKRKNNPSEATIMFSTALRKYALTAAATLIVSGAVAPSSSNAELIILGQKPQSLPDRCPAQRELSNANPWSAAAEKYYGKEYAQTLADLNIALQQDDDVVLLRIYESLRDRRAPDVLSNAANALMVAAQIRRDNNQLSAAQELFERLYRAYHDGRDKATGQTYPPYRDIAIMAQAKLVQIYLLQGAASQGAEAVKLYKAAQDAAREVQRTATGRNMATIDPNDFNISVVAADSAIAFATKDGALANSSITQWHTLKSAQKPGPARASFSITFGATALALAEIISPENKTALLASIRQDAVNSLAAISQPSPLNSSDTALQHINETMQGAWHGYDLSLQDRCAMTAQLKAVVAQVDLLTAKDAAQRETARQNLSKADRMLSELPPYRHDPVYKLNLAQSYWDEAHGQPQNVTAEWRHKAETALSESARLQQFCFCAETNVQIKALQKILRQ